MNLKPLGGIMPNDPPNCGVTKPLENSTHVTGVRALLPI